MCCRTEMCRLATRQHVVVNGQAGGDSRRREIHDGEEFRGLRILLDDQVFRANQSAYDAKFHASSLHAELTVGSREHRIQFVQSPGTGSIHDVAGHQRRQAEHPAAMPCCGLLGVQSNGALVGCNLFDAAMRGQKCIPHGLCGELVRGRRDSGFRRKNRVSGKGRRRGVVHHHGEGDGRDHLDCFSHGVCPLRFFCFSVSDSSQ